MEADNSPAPSRGGTVEPANRAKVAREVFQMPNDPPATRYELRDPFANLTYRIDSFKDMAAKADQLGATRFQAIAVDGTKTFIAKVDGMWKDPSLGQSPSRPSNAGASERTSNVVPLPPSGATPSAATTTAKIDAEAERAARIATLEAALFERYVVKRAALKIGDLAVGQTEYRFRGDTNKVAFTETTFKLATESNNPSVARSMVDVAEARNWQGLRVYGNEEFKRLVWLESSLRGVKAIGYEPQLADQELLKREREARSVNRIEPASQNDPTRGGSAPPSDPAKASARGNGGRKAVLAALEAVLVQQGVPGKQRDAVMAAAAENLARRLARGEVHKVKVFDRSAPAPRSPAQPSRDIQRTQERPAPAR